MVNSYQNLVKDKEKMYILAVEAGHKLDDQTKDAYLNGADLLEGLSVLTKDQRFAIKWMRGNCKGDLHDCWYN